LSSVGITSARQDWSAESIRRWLGVILLAAFALRLAALWVTQPTGLVNDEYSYFTLAKQFALGADIADADGRAPGVVFFYAALMRVFGASADVARLGNVVLSTASVWLVYSLGRRFASTLVGLGAAAIVACYPGLIGFSHSLWSETLYVFLELGALLLLATHRDGNVWLRLAGAGLLFGMGALTREVGLIVAVFCAGSLVYEGWPHWKTGVAKAALTLAACMVVVLPWSAHLKATTGHSVLITGNTWFNLYIASVGEKMVNGQKTHPWNGYQLLGDTRSERETAARPIALRAVWNQMPLWPIKKLREFNNLLAPTSFVVKRLRTAADDEGSATLFVLGKWRYVFKLAVLDGPLVREGFALLTMATYVAVLLLGVAGLLLTCRSGAGQLLPLFLAFILGHVLPPLVTFALTRFRLPLMPIMAIGAASLLQMLWAEGRGVWGARSQARRYGAAIAVCGATVAIVGGYLTSVA
jgi:4-amino-4-deoxy-L-arabinose transferase-like glycosyltransferase